VSKPIVLKIFRNGGVVDIKQFVTETHIVIGSSETDVNVKLPGQISPFHASIEKRGDKYFLTDLGSTQGTYLKGNKILEAGLEHGDKIAIGEYIIEFYIGAPGPVVTAPQAAAAPAPAATTTPITTHPTGAAAPKPIPPRPATPAPSPIPRVASTVGGGVASMSSYAAAPSGKKAKGSKTFAPASNYKNLSEFIKPTKGSTVEVIVAWKERVIGSYHFRARGTYNYGSHPSCDILVPSMGTKVNKAPLLQLDGQATVFVPPGMNGSLVVENNSTPLSQLYSQGRLQSASAGGSKLTLAQGEMVRVALADGVELVIRYCGETPKPVFIPMLDLASNGFLAVLLAVILAIVVSLYVALNKSDKPPVDDEEYRTALIIDNPPKPPPQPPQPKMEEVKPPDVKPPEPPKVVKQETPKEPPKEMPKAPETKKQPAPTPRQATKQQQQAQKSGGGGNGQKAASMSPTNRPKSNAPGSVKKGGAVKTTDKPASQAQSTTKDPSHSGIFGVFGTSGKQDKLAKDYTGGGELAGEAANATGKSGYNEDRAGQGLGSKLAEVGSGTGHANQGISGHGNGNGLGMGHGDHGSGFGSGVGLGGKASVTILPEGSGESYSGNIDRNGIRQVFLNNQRALQSCYEAALASDKSLSGKLVLDFDIGEQGRVLRADYSRDKSTLTNSQLATCVINRMKNWRFPEPPQNQTVQVFYPLAFSGK